MLFRTLVECFGTFGSATILVLVIEKGFELVETDIAELERAILVDGTDSRGWVVLDRFMGRACTYGVS